MSEFEFSEELLKIYYKKLFPYELFCKWLTYGNSADLLKREFSFTLAGDVYLRYQSYATAADLRKDLNKLIPHKIDIGAVYSCAPRKQRTILSNNLKPEWKELVFDIDLTDYDDVRYCCGPHNSSSNTAVCCRCWPLAQSAVLCVDRALREDFGFDHLLWVYSGRRGVHCWVCDDSARKLDPASRTAIVEYLTLVRGGNARKPVLTAGGSYGKTKDNHFAPERQLHPCVDAASDLLIPRFSAYCSTNQGQDLFGEPTRMEKLLSLLPESLNEAKEQLTQGWLDKVTGDCGDISLRRWNTLRKFLKEHGRTNVLKELVISYTYPRLDVNVSTGLNHLLKSPFCIHPKTGYVCIPFDPRDVTALVPSKVPTLKQLLDEIDLKSSENETNSGTEGQSTQKHLLPYKMTSLKPMIEYFEAFVQRLCSSASLSSSDSYMDVATTSCPSTVAAF